MLSRRDICFPSSNCGYHTPVPRVVILWSGGDGDRLGTEYHGHDYGVEGIVPKLLEVLCLSYQKDIPVCLENFAVFFKWFLVKKTSLLFEMVQVVKQDRHQNTGINQDIVLSESKHVTKRGCKEQCKLKYKASMVYKQSK